MPSRGGRAAGVIAPGPALIRLVRANGGYAGKLMRWARTRLWLMVRVAKRSDAAVSSAPALGRRTHRGLNHPIPIDAAAASAMTNDCRTIMKPWSCWTINKIIGS